MERKRNHFFDGFVFGAAMGAAAVFLFGTKQGRHIVKIAKEQGREKFGQLEDMLSVYQSEMGDEFEEGIEEIKEKVSSIKSEKSKLSPHKKLFKGLGKRK